MPADRAKRPWWLLPVLLAAVVAVIVPGYLMTQRAAPPAPSPTPAPSEPGRFAPWVAFERIEPAKRQELSDYYIDAMLGHQVFRLPPNNIPINIGRQFLLDDDELLLSSGRRLWSREALNQPGLAGKFCFIHSTFCLKRLFDTTFAVDGAPAVIYDNQFVIQRFPSYTAVRYGLPGVTVDEYKFITYDDRAVATYAVRSQDQKAHAVTLEVTAPYPPVPNATGTPKYPLLAHGEYQGNPLYVYLDAPGFEALETANVVLQRRLDVPADGTPARATVSVRFDDQPSEVPAAPLGDDPLSAHAREYDRWFADNVPFFDSSDAGFKKMWYYRWWIVRFQLAELRTPDLSGYAFYEGKLGFDNVIGFAVPAQVKELTYLRDPKFGLSQIANAYRNRAPNGAVVDAPGSPYWGETYSHWIAMATAEFNRVHPIPPDMLKTLLPEMAEDVRAWMSVYDADGDGLPERDRPRVTGYDLDILSYWFFNDTKFDDRVMPPALERVDFASFVYANAAAGAELAEDAGDDDLAREFADRAARIRAATLADLWDDQTGFFYPQRATDHVRAPIRELHGFFPFTTLLAPNEPRYVRALDKFVDPNEFWARFPPVITSTAHYRQWTWEMDGLTRNIAPHPISMGARTLLQALKHYDQTTVTPEHFMQLMASYNDLVFPGVNPFDPYWRPNVHEYYSKWEPHAVSDRPKPSDISHDFHSMYCSLIVEGAVGLTPRRDERIELRPLARQWSYFLLDRLRYRGHDLRILWDRPDGQVRYDGYPEGFSLYIDGKLAFTRPTLDPVIYEPATGKIETPTAAD